MDGTAVFRIKVKTGRPHFMVKKTMQGLKVFLTEKPEKGTANAELVKEMSRLFGARVSLVAGFKSREKRVRVEGVSQAEAEKLLARETGEQINNA